MTPEMRHSKSALELTERFEGVRLTAYRDVRGVLTIGYGHTRDVFDGQTCSTAQALAWLGEDYANAERCTNYGVKVGLNQEEFDALVDFVFNVGCVAFYHSTLLRYINRLDWTKAVKQFLEWDYAGGKVCAGLLARRRAESDLFQQLPDPPEVHNDPTA